MAAMESVAILTTMAAAVGAQQSIPTRRLGAGCWRSWWADRVFPQWDGVWYGSSIVCACWSIISL